MELTFAIASRQLWGGWGGPKVVSLGDQVADARLEPRAWRRALLTLTQSAIRRIG